MRSKRFRTLRLAVILLEPLRLRCWLMIVALSLLVGIADWESPKKVLINIPQKCENANTMFSKLKLDRPLAVFDIEATGLSPRTDRIIELSIIRIEPIGRESTCTWLLNPCVPIPIESTAIHGITDEDVRVISGSVLYGTKAEGPFDYLGRFTNQVSALPEGDHDAFMGWIMPGAKEHSVTRTTLGGFLQGVTCKFTTKLYGGKRPILPIESFDKVMPLDIYPVLLLRSLAVTDTDEAQKLGCLELTEEDMQLLTYVDPGKNDWGPILRRNLDKIEKEG